jgi:hypothetical protein
MKNNLDKVNFIEGADAKFGYAVARNKARAESIIRAMDKTREPSNELNEYRKELDKINLKYAQKDPDGTVGYVMLNSHGGSVRAYRKIVGDGNPDSEHGKEIAALKVEYSAVIKEFEAKTKTYEELLNKDIPEDDFRKLIIDLEIVPAGLHPDAMSGCLEFIKEQE